MNRVRYFPPAEEELLDGIAYLESQSKGLGRRFLNEVKRVELEVAQFPQSGATIAQAFAGVLSIRFAIH